MKIVLFTYSHLYADMFRSLFAYLQWKKKREKNKMCEIYYFILFYFILLCFFLLFLQFSSSVAHSCGGSEAWPHLKFNLDGKIEKFLWYAQFQRQFLDFNHIAVIFNSFYYYCYCPQTLQLLLCLMAELFERTEHQKSHHPLSDDNNEAQYSCLALKILQFNKQFN